MRQVSSLSISWSILRCLILIVFGCQVFGYNVFHHDSTIFNFIAEFLVSNCFYQCPSAGWHAALHGPWGVGGRHQLLTRRLPAHRHVRLRPRPLGGGGTLPRDWASHTVQAGRERRVRYKFLTYCTLYFGPVLWKRIGIRIRIFSPFSDPAWMKEQIPVGSKI